jgi:non-heme chloroperoxidase
MRSEPEPPSLAKLGLPIFVLGGERDPMFPGSAQRALADRQKAIRLKLWPEVGHNPHWEVPEEAGEALLGFL